MNTARNLQIVSLYFLLATGLIHFFTGMMYVNEYFPDWSLLINKVSDLPFLAAGLFYLGSSVKLHIDPEPNKKVDLGIAIACGIIFLLVLGLNLGLQDKI